MIVRRTKKALTKADGLTIALALLIAFVVLALVLTSCDEVQGQFTPHLAGKCGVVTGRVLIVKKSLDSTLYNFQDGVFLNAVTIRKVEFADTTCNTRVRWDEDSARVRSDER